MNVDKNKDYRRWVNAVIILSKQGWKCLNKWIFESPTGTLHDMSAADLLQCDRIEAEGHFLINSK